MEVTAKSEWELAGEDVPVRELQRANQDLQQAYNELSVFFEVAKAVGEATNLDEILNTVLETIGQIIEYRGCVVFELCDRDGNTGFGEFIARSTRGGEAGFLEKVETHRDEGLLSWALQRRRPLVVPDHQEGSFVIVPLSVDGRASFVMDLWAKLADGQITKHSLDLLSLLASQAAIAIDHSHLYARTERQVEQLSALDEVARATVEAFSLEELLESIVHTITKVFQADRCSFMLLDEETGELRMKMAVGFGGEGGFEARAKIGEGIAGRVALAREPLLVRDVDTDPRLPALRAAERGPEDWGEYTGKSFMCAPLVVKGRTLGVLNLTNKRDGGQFTKDEFQLFILLTNQASLALEMARQHEAAVKAMDYARDILESMTSGLISVNQRRVVTTFNRAAEEITGLEASGVLGCPCEDLPSLGPLVSLISQALQERRTVSRREVEFVRGGEKVLLGVATSLLSGASDQPLGALAVFSDLTAVKELEARMRRADKLAALGQMAAGLAHEIRNPLNPIRGFAQLLLNDLADEEQRGYARIILEEVDILDRFVTDFLAFAREVKLNLAPVDLPELLDRAVALAQKDAVFQDIEVSLHCDRDLPAVLLDEARFRQALLNIVLNAAQAMQGKGRLELRVASPMRRGGPLNLSIADTGPGIDSETLSRIFDPFFTTKESGTGLGLAITHRIIEDHGGSVQVESQQGVGTTFHLQLPTQATSCEEDSE